MIASKEQDAGSMQAEIETLKFLNGQALESINILVQQLKKSEEKKQAESEELKEVSRICEEIINDATLERLREAKADLMPSLQNWLAKQKGKAS